MSARRWSIDGQRAAIQRMLGALTQGVTVPHVIVDHDRLVGRSPPSNMARGAFGGCNIGYRVSDYANGEGHATAAVGQMSRVECIELGWHRIEPDTLPHNIVSKCVLGRNGFERIGVARAIAHGAERSRH